MMNRPSKIAAGAALVLLSFAKSPAQAQWAVECVNCSTTWQQVIQEAHEVSSLANQTTSLANQATNLARMPGTSFANFRNDTGNLNNIAQGGGVLSGQMNGLISRLQSGSYPTGNYNALQQQLQAAHAQEASNVTNLQTMLSAQQGQIGSDTAQLENLKARAAQTNGEQSALNVTNELAANQNAEIMKVSASQMAMTQAFATQASIQNDRQASEDAQAKAILPDPTSVSVSDGAAY